MKLISLINCQDGIEANLIKGRLENGGIQCFTTNENFSNLMPHFFRLLGSGVQVFINKNDLDRAKKILNLNDKESAIDIICPNCNSRNIAFTLGKYKLKKIIIIIFSLLAFIPFNNINNNYFCKDCKTDFKK